MDYSSSFPITSDIDFSSAFNNPSPINFDAVGESVFPTQNILGVNKNLNTINRIGQAVSSMGSSNVPQARPIGAEEMNVREQLQKMGEELNRLKNDEKPKVETLDDKMKTARSIIEQAVKDFKDFA
jgi:phage-related protein|tara:strand:+ start:641 stop:1018 length:378 start_codon:yes stop_codon:yes gene_type:complete